MNMICTSGHELGNPASIKPNAASSTLLLCFVIAPLHRDSNAVPLAAGAPEAVQALALRLGLRLWRVAGGRQFHRLRALLLVSQASSGLALRLARAACLRDVCAADGERGTQLVAAVQVRVHVVPYGLCMRGEGAGGSTRGLRDVQKMRLKPGVSVDPATQRGGKGGDVPLLENRLLL